MSFLWVVSLFLGPFFIRTRICTNTQIYTHAQKYIYTHYIYIYNLFKYQSKKFVKNLVIFLYFRSFFRFPVHNYLFCQINFELIKRFTLQRPLSIKQYGFRISRSTADLLTFIAERVSNFRYGWSMDCWFGYIEMGSTGFGMLVFAIWKFMYFWTNFWFDSIFFIKSRVCSWTVNILNLFTLMQVSARAVWKAYFHYRHAVAR